MSKLTSVFGAFALCFIFFSISFNANAQKARCYTDENLQAQFKLHPEWIKLQQHADSLGDAHQNAMAKSTDTTVRIVPVVFHVIHEYGKENISSELVDALSQIFEVERLNEYCLPDAPGIIHLLMKNKYYKLKIPAKYKETGNAKACLDVSILENLVFKNILKIEDTRSSERIYFLNGAESPEKIKYLLDEKKVRAVFALYPLDIKDVIEISDAGETMPPKSTWIEPKLRSGLVIHSF